MPARRVTRLGIDGMSIRVHSSTGAVDRNAPTFVLLHGIGMSHRYLRRLHESLAHLADVHSIDLPGYGANHHPRRDLGVADNADLIARTATIMGVDRFVAVGHSMGAQFAIETAIRHPHRVTELALIGPVVDPARRTAVQQGLSLAADTLRETPAINTVVFTDYMRCGIPWYLDQLRHMLDYQIEDRIADVAAPVVVMRGEHDPIASDPWCRMLTARAQHGSLVSVPRGAHVVQQRRAVAVRDAIVSFVAAHASGVTAGG